MRKEYEMCRFRMGNGRPDPVFPFYENAPRIVDNLLKKLGEVVGLAPSKSKTVISEAATSELSAAVKVSTPKSAGAGVEVRLRDANVPELAGSTEILIKGKVVAITPAASSKTINEAAIWYRAELNKRANAIDKTLPLEAQIIQAETLAQELMNGATASLFDKELAATLREAFARPSIEKLKNEIGGAGEKQLLAVLEKSTAADKTRKWFEPGACFAAGTLVHTKEGLVPIEQIKVGDWVLSKPENGGEQAYKRVLQTFAHEPQRVIGVEYIADPGKGISHQIVCTVKHPFWEKDIGWTPAEDLYLNFTRKNWLELVDGQSVECDGTTNIYVSETPGVGWTSSFSGDVEATGALWDYVNHRLIANGVMALETVQNHQIPYNDSQFGTFPDELYLHLPVYNLEVEDFHTYYVGKHGVWVHNTNCGGLSFEVKPPAPALTAEMQGRSVVTRAELNALLQKDGIDTGVFLVRADAKSQAGLIPFDQQPNWLKFEEGVTGRIIASDGSRWEYAGYQGQVSHLAKPAALV